MVFKTSTVLAGARELLAAQMGYLPGMLWILAGKGAGLERDLLHFAGRGLGAVRPSA